MIDIIIATWIIWGIIVGRRTHLYYLIGDVVALSCVVVFYKTINAMDLSIISIDTYKQKIIELYLWLEPMQSTQIHGDRMLMTAIDLFAYFLLVVFLLAVIGVFRNGIAAFSEYEMKGTIVNASIGCLRNAMLAFVMILLLPEALLETYWIFEISRDSLIFKVIH